MLTRINTKSFTLGPNKDTHRLDLELHPTLPTLSGTIRAIVFSILAGVAFGTPIYLQENRPDLLQKVKQGDIAGAAVGGFQTLAPADQRSAQAQVDKLSPKAPVPPDILPVVAKIIGIIVKNPDDTYRAEITSASEDFLLKNFGIMITAIYVGEDATSGYNVEITFFKWRSGKGKETKLWTHVAKNALEIPLDKVIPLFEEKAD